MAQTKRKGASRRAQIPPDVLERLNRGETETVNLMEALAIDHRALLRHVLIDLDRADYLEPLLADIAALSKPSFISTNRTIGEGLWTLISRQTDYDLWTKLIAHPSDVVRYWACYAIACQELTLEERFTQIAPLAADEHFGVREVAWLALRPLIARHLEHCLDILTPWVHDPNPNIRRFATESTRPRGVWCQHIDRLKSTPELAIGLLEPLKSDPARYVQDSVANWLNDASKTVPGFVIELTNRWLRESPTPETQYIVKRARRTLNKQGQQLP